MITKNELKYYSSLLQKKYRNEEKKFLAEGKKIVEEGLNSRYKAECIIISAKFEEENGLFIAGLPGRATIHTVHEKEYLKLSGTVNPQGITAVFNCLPPAKPEEINAPVAVYLDEISDPGNVGTILRNCDWFGVYSIILSRNCADIYNPKTLRGSMGAVFHLSFYDAEKENPLRLLKEKGYTIFCSDLNGTSIYGITQKPEKSVLIFSNEAHGPSGEARNFADAAVTIPRKGKAESLNVASASAVILSEWTK